MMNIEMAHVNIEMAHLTRYFLTKLEQVPSMHEETHFG